MSLTIGINNLSLAHKGSNGIATATAPDVCKTPSPGGPVPIPYPNIAMLMDANGGTACTKVKIANKNALHQSTQISKSSGDEAGVAGGVVSGKIMGEMTFKLGSNTVKLEGQKAVYQNAMTAHNGVSANLPAGGTHMAPSQTSVKIGP